MICDSNLRRLCVIVVTAALIHIAAVNVQGQVTGGTISGTVTDSTGKVVPNVHISITNTATGRRPRSHDQRRRLLLCAEFVTGHV